MSVGGACAGNSISGAEQSSLGNQNVTECEIRSALACVLMHSGGRWVESAAHETRSLINTGVGYQKKTGPFNFTRVAWD